MKKLLIPAIILLSSCNYMADDAAEVIVKIKKHNRDNLIKLRGTPKDSIYLVIDSLIEDDNNFYREFKGFVEGKGGLHKTEIELEKYLK